MRVLHVYRTYFPDTQGGLEEAIRQICRATAGFDVQSSVYTVSPHPVPATLSLPEARVHRVRRSVEVASCGFATPSGVARFARLAREHDLVHYHLPWPFADMLHLGLRVETPALATYHSDVVRQRLLGALYKPLLDRFLRSMGTVVATSPQYARSSPVLSRLGAKLQIVPLTIDPATYPRPSAQSVAAWRDRLGEPFFLFVGVLRYYKGLDVLLEAAANTPYSIAIAGDGPEGPRLRRLAAARGLRHVAFLGHVSDEDKAALIEGCRAIVFPSHLRAEAFGMTLLEGAMFGRALISCEIGTGTSFINVHDETGLVVGARDPGALAAAMETLASHPARARALGEGGRERFARLFNASAVGAAYSSIYRSLLSGANQAA